MILINAISFDIKKSCMNLKDAGYMKPSNTPVILMKKMDELSCKNFNAEQPALAQTVFNIFPALIAEQNQEMANMFLELCFDTLCVYQHAFGNAPPQTKEWLEPQAALMDAEFQALIPENKMNPLMIMLLRIPVKYLL